MDVRLLKPFVVDTTSSRSEKVEPVRARRTSLKRLTLKLNRDKTRRIEHHDDEQDFDFRGFRP
jgi:hypothetical protein